MLNIVNPVQQSVSDAQQIAPEDLGDCAWCDGKAIDIIYTEGKPSSLKHKSAPVCFEHYKHFIARGMISRRDYWATIGRKK